MKSHTHFDSGKFYDKKLMMSYFLQMIKIAIIHVWEGKALPEFLGYNKALQINHLKHKNDEKITA